MIRTSLFAGAALFAAAALVSVVVDAQAPARRTTAPAARTAASAPAIKPAPPGALPPLPAVSFTPVEPMPVVQQVYEFAARHPEVLPYVPCYCGCERGGHKANHDCFVKSRAADGRVTEWDAHGMGCAVCLDVGRKAMAMFKQGMTVQQIRTAIDREYDAHFPSHTPTPQPPAAKKG